MYQIVYGNLILAQGETKADCVCQLNSEIEIETVGESQRAIVRNKLWVNKECVVHPSYSMEFKHYEILEDIAEKVCSMHGYTLQKIERTL